MFIKKKERITLFLLRKIEYLSAVPLIMTLTFLIRSVQDIMLTFILRKTVGLFGTMPVRTELF